MTRVHVGGSNMSHRGFNKSPWVGFILSQYLEVTDNLDHGWGRAGHRVSSLGNDPGVFSWTLSECHGAKRPREVTNFPDY